LERVLKSLEVSGARPYAVCVIREVFNEIRKRGVTEDVLRRTIVKLFAL